MWLTYHDHYRNQPRDNVKTLFDADTLHSRIHALGKEIRQQFGDEPVTAICVLKGSFLFLADLVRAMDGDVRIELPAS